MKVAMLGLGAMGAAIARRLESAVEELVVYNRSPAPIVEFEHRGVRTASTPAAAASAADAAISMLADGEAVATVLLHGPGAVLGEKNNALPRMVVDMSTIDVETSARVAARANQLGVDYLRAPVSGNPGVVAAGGLAIIASGDRETFQSSLHLLQEIGPTALYVGTGERARVMKLALNLMLAGTTQLLAEALVLGEANGLDPGEMLEVINSSVIGSRFTAYKAGPLLEDDFTSTFSSRLMHKDLRMAIECAGGVAVPLPVTATVQGLMMACVRSGMADLDFSALVPRLQREAGLRDDLPRAASQVAG
jgi:3-hydroxyisobutyrate dehydrogenase-like beta-hydroxyacid dehydrogenase